MPLTKTPWKLETSEDLNTTIAFFTGGEGKLYFVHDSTGEKLTVKYNYFAAGMSKGAIANIAESLTTDPSGGFSNVKVRDGFSFGTSSFPCKGWLLMGGATAGIFQPSFMSQSGGSVALAMFGAIPFGGIPIWGRFNSIMPGAGPSVAFVNYSV